MTDMEKMKPIVILQKDSMGKEDIKRLRANGLCVVESKTPALVRYMEPVPLGYSDQQWAAIELARQLLTEGKVANCNHRASISALYVDILLRGDPLKRIEPIASIPKAAS